MARSRKSGGAPARLPEWEPTTDTEKKETQTLFKRLLGFLPRGGGIEDASVILIRLAVGTIFLTQGILKFTDPKMGVLRFARIGFPVPAFTAHFVGVFEIGCGALVLAGLLTRLACVPLLAVIVTAIATTKIPELFRPGQGFWFAVSDARTDFSMLCGLLFLLLAGPGRWSFDWARSRHALHPSS